MKKTITSYRKDIQHIVTFSVMAILAVFLAFQIFSTDKALAFAGEEDFYVAPAYDSDEYVTYSYEYYEYPYSEYSNDYYYSYSGNYDYVYPSYSYTEPTYTYSAPTYTYTTPTYNYSTYTYESGPTCTLTASDYFIDEGDRTTLRWTTDNATSVTINHGIGSVSRNSSRQISPDESETYVLTATGPNGSVQCSETIFVDEEYNNNNDDVQCDSFTVSDSSVDEGDRVTLRWRTTGADDVRINNGVGSVSNDGSEMVTIDDDTTFTLTARDGSDTDTCRVTVRADDDNDVTAPYCKLSISDTSINPGEDVTLSWNNLRTDRAVLRDTHGKEIADSHDDQYINEDRDSVIVRPTRSTDYTLTVYNKNVKRTCTVGTDVDGVTVTQVRSQDSIALTQTPYTGFEAGPVLTYIFYGAIVLWGVIMAYVLVLRKKPQVTASAHGTGLHEDIHHHTHSEHDTAVEQSHNHISFIPENLPTDEVEDIVLEYTEDSIHALEQHAHTQYALVSSDALRFIEGQSGTVEEQIATLDRVIALAKARFPKEGDWIVINKERVISLLG